MDKVFGCGIDIEELSRFDKHVHSGGSHLMEDICTRAEIENPCRDSRVALALRFACKEAFFKAFGVSWTNSAIAWKDIELLFGGPGLDQYQVVLHGYAEELLLRNNAGIGELSFDVSDEFVLFEVVLLREGDL